MAERAARGAGLGAAAVAVLVATVVGVGVRPLPVGAVPVHDTFPLVVGESTAGLGPGALELETPGSTDTYTFTASAGQGFFPFGYQPVCWDTFSCGLTATLTSPGGGTSPPRTIESFASFHQPFALTETGTYSLTIAHPGEDTGFYDLDTYWTAPGPMALALGQEVTAGVPVAGAGQLDLREIDVYTVAAAPGFLTIDWGTCDLSGGCFASWRLYGPDGDELAGNWIGVEGEWIPVGAGGTHTLVVFSAAAMAAGVSGPYGFTVGQAPPLIPGEAVADSHVAGLANERHHAFPGQAGQPLDLATLSCDMVPSCQLWWAVDAPDGTRLFEEFHSDVVPVTLPQDGYYTLTAIAGVDPVTFDPTGGSYSFVPRTWPGAPTGVATVAGDSRATVSWAAPATGGFPALDVTVTVTAAPGGATCTTGGTSCTLTGLANGTVHTVTATATNPLGPGAASAPIAVTPVAPPLPPPPPPPPPPPRPDPPVPPRPPSPKPSPPSPSPPRPKPPPAPSPEPSPPTPDRPAPRPRPERDEPVLPPPGPLGDLPPLRAPLGAVGS